MAIRYISTRLAIEGYEESQQKIRAYNAEWKTHQSELKLVESEYKNNANSAAALTAKSEVLTKAYATQQQRVAALKEALEAAQKAQQTYAERIEDTKAKISAIEKEMADLANSTGDTTAREAELKAQLEKLNAELATHEGKAAAAQRGINDWERQLNNAKVELNSLDREIDKNSTYLDEAKASADGCAVSIDKYGKETKQAKEESEQFGKASKGAVDTLAAALAAAGLTRALSEIKDAIVACSQASIEFESAIVGVFKTVEGTDEQLAAITEGIKQMALDIPVSTTELSGIAEAAGQLGIQTDNVIGFTRVMADLGKTTNISSTEGAQTLAQFANIVQMNQGNFDRLGSTIVALGNNFASTEADILAMAQRLAGAGAQVGLTEAEILGFATALSSVGVEAEAGGSAFSRVFSNMQVAVETGKESLTDYATVAGMTVTDFSRLFKQDAASAITAFIEGLSGMSEEGMSSIAVLEEMGITELRLRDSLLRTSNAGDLVRRSVDLASIAWKENTALTREAELRYGTTESKLQLVSNAAEGTKRAIGDVLAPALRDIAEAGTDGFEWATDFIKDNPWLVKAITGVAVAVGVLSAGLLSYTVVTKVATAVTGVFTAMLQANPVVLVVTAVLSLIAALATFIITAESATDSHDELIKSMRESKKAHEENVVAIEGEAKSIDTLIKSVVDLADKEDKTATEKKILLGLIDELNQKVPNLSLAYDEQADSLNLTAEAIMNVAKAQADAKRQQTEIDRISELYVEQAKIADDLLNAQTELESAQKAYNKALNDGGLESSAYTAQLVIAQGAVDEAQKKVREAIAANNENVFALHNATAAMAENVATTTGAQGPIEEAMTGISSSMDELEQAYKDAYDAAYMSINDQIGLWETMDNKAKTSTDDLNKSLESQISFLDSYTDNLNSLSMRNVEGVDKLVELLSDGSKESAAILAGLAEVSDSEIIRVVKNLSRVEEAKKTWSSTTAALQVDLEEKLDAISTRMNELADEMNQKNAWNDSAIQTADGYIEGLKSKEEEVVWQAKRLAILVNKSFRDTLKIQSPSRVMMETGEYTMEGLLEGFRAREAEVKAQLEKTASMVADMTVPDVSRISNSSVSSSTSVTHIKEGDIHIAVEAKDLKDLNDVYELVRQAKSARQTYRAGGGR